MTSVGEVGMTSSREEVAVFGDTITLRGGVVKDTVACMMTEPDGRCQSTKVWVVCINWGLIWSRSIKKYLKN